MPLYKDGIFLKGIFFLPKPIIMVNPDMSLLISLMSAKDISGTSPPSFFIRRTISSAPVLSKSFSSERYLIFKLLRDIPCLLIFICLGHGTISIPFRFPHSGTGGYLNGFSAAQD